MVWLYLLQTDGIHSHDNVRPGNHSAGTVHTQNHVLPPVKCPLHIHTHTHAHTHAHAHTHTHAYARTHTHTHTHIESLSEAVKLLKAEYLVKAISALKMDQAIIFCRTKLDCDNIENHLMSLGGGLSLQCTSAVHILLCMLVYPFLTQAPVQW